MVLSVCGAVLSLSGGHCCLSSKEAAYSSGAATCTCGCHPASSSIADHVI
jgi:hypothetical protein